MRIITPRHQTLSCLGFNQRFGVLVSVSNEGWGAEILIKRCAVWFCGLFLMVVVSILEAQEQPKIAEYRDSQYPYSFQYPAHWKLKKLPEGAANDDVRVSPCLSETMKKFTHFVHLESRCDLSVRSFGNR